MESSSEKNARAASSASGMPQSQLDSFESFGVPNAPASGQAIYPPVDPFGYDWTGRQHHVARGTSHPAQQDDNQRLPYQQMPSVTSLARALPFRQDAPLKRREPQDEAQPMLSGDLFPDTTHDTNRNGMGSGSAASDDMLENLSQERPQQFMRSGAGSATTLLSHSSTDAPTSSFSPSLLDSVFAAPSFPSPTVELGLATATHTVSSFSLPTPDVASFLFSPTDTALWNLLSVKTASSLTSLVDSAVPSMPQSTILQPSHSGLQLPPPSPTNASLPLPLPWASSSQQPSKGHVDYSQQLSLNGLFSFLPSADYRPESTHSIPGVLNGFEMLAQDVISRGAQTPSQPVTDAPLSFPSIAMLQLATSVSRPSLVSIQSQKRQATTSPPREAEPTRNQPKCAKDDDVLARDPRPGHDGADERTDWLQVLYEEVREYVEISDMRKGPSEDDILKSVFDMIKAWQDHDQQRAHQIEGYKELVQQLQSELCQNGTVKEALALERDIATCEKAAALGEGKRKDSALEMAVRESEGMRKELRQAYVELRRTKDELGISRGKLETERRNSEMEKSELATTRSRLEATRSELETTRGKLQSKTEEARQVSEERDRKDHELRRVTDELQRYREQSSRP
ncbi:hypothetical protein EVG20_g8959 [Dentipellis fragilis]|uniref:Uncharacterized protein n=1 Tax=Dentipellis fragilis TaxID=205917 RepID=A0A4Y9Y4K7_9AGAM|nr:hypothetical protein EVG20_g8959 [Dentipellis fragilis]